MSQGQSGRGGMRGGRRGGPGRGGPGQGGQGQSRRGTTTTPQAVRNMRADIANRRGTLYSPSLRDAVTRANEAARARSLDARKARAAQEAIQAQEAKQVSPTAAGIEGMISSMDREREGLRNLARRNRITNTQLNRLGALNEAIGLNRTTGMGPIESVRSTVSNPAFRTGIGNLARAYSKISPLGIIMRNILNPQYDQPTGIQSLPDFQGMQRTNQMFGPGVYDFTRPTPMPMNLAEATPDQRGFLRGLLDRFINPSIMEESIDPGLEQQDKKRDIIEQMREESAFI
jgi:hypothetical protein